MELQQQEIKVSAEVANAGIQVREGRNLALSLNKVNGYVNKVLGKVLKDGALTRFVIN